MIRRLACAFAALAASLIAASGASAMAPYVVVDVNSGRVIMAEDATVPWYPASVTKLMTAYVTLRQLKAGAIGLETPIPVSRVAASVPPSKIGVRPGQEVTLDNALKMLLVKSANDMAVVIAEGVGGNVENFADMMNREAQRIGMRESHFINPNGLFVEGQQTSARDMAVLARQLLVEFPEYAHYFNIGALQLGKRVLKNTNGLIGRYPGIEGMKTGFICASGFNLVAVASRNGQRLIAVVFGASSNAERTLRAAEMLDKGFAKWGGSVGSLDSLPASAITAPPNMREDICVRRKGAPPSEEEADSAMVATTSQADDGRVLLSGGSAAMAVAGGVRVPGTRSLIPRAEFDPIPVAIGRTAGSSAAPLAANATQGKTTATAYAGDKKAIDPNAEPVEAGADPLKIKPQPTQLSLTPAAKAKGKQTAKAEAGEAQKAKGKTVVAPAKAKHAAPAKPAGKSGGKSVASATPGKAKPGAAKPAPAKAAPAKAKAPAAAEDGADAAQ
ncbi:MAG: D-alanyl-D-alanine carboxypeptidase family protein [Alsobacter sp.]